MGFLIAIAVVFVGFAVFVLLTQMAVRNGIRMSGVIDWKTQYELGRAASRSRWPNCMRAWLNPRMTRTRWSAR